MSCILRFSVSGFESLKLLRLAESGPWIILSVEQELQ